MSRAGVIASIAVLTAGVCGCGGDESGVPRMELAEVTPALSAACADADAALAELVGVEPTSETLARLDTVLDDLRDAVPLADTEVGQTDTGFRSPLLGLGRPLSQVSNAISSRDDTLDVAELESELRLDFDTFQAAATVFGLDGCFESSVIDTVFVAQLAVYDEFLVQIAPTGDFDVDIAAVCERYREGEAELLLDNITAPNAEFTVFSRLRGLADRLTTDIERLDAPAEVESDVALLLDALAQYRRDVSAVESARLVSQSATDAALETFDASEIEVERLLVAIYPDC